MFDYAHRRKPWGELTVLLLAALALLIAAAVAADFEAESAWMLIAVLGGAYALSRGFARNDWPRESIHPPAHAAPPRAEGPTRPMEEGVAEVVVSEERLDVDKRSLPHERVVLRKEVVTETVTISVPVRREVLRVERIPIEPGSEPAVDELTAFAPGEAQELILMEERAVVDKRVVPRERVRLAKDVVTEDQHITETVRREEVDVDRQARPSVQTEQEHDQP
jgi:uncharacterized protein (TIGR02271 family)